MKAIGYGDKLSALPGDAVAIKVRSETEWYSAEFVRMRSARPPIDGERWERVHHPIDGQYQGRWQETPIGSYIHVDDFPPIDMARGFTAACWINPALLERPQGQGIIAGPEFRLELDPAGKIAFHHPGTRSQALVSNEPLMLGEWHFVAATASPAPDEGLRLSCWRLPRSWLPEVELEVHAQEVESRRSNRAGLLIGAGRLEENADGRLAPRGCFNGKVDRPAIWDRALTAEEIDAIRSGSPAIGHENGLVAAWDFSLDPSSDIARDVSGFERHGRCVNYPMRGAVGANWDGTCLSFTSCPEQYGAIAFHEDDLSDCRWQTDFTLEIPDDLESGVYGVSLKAGDSEDIVPMYVLRPVGDPSADILFLAPTYTYLAYANERLFDGVATGMDFIEKSTDQEIVLGEWEAYMADHPELGASVYDIHPDGSGICYSSRLRPVMTMRPGWVNWLSGGIRHFSADLYLLEWLHARGYRHDVATDEDLHREGKNLLKGYKVVITGGHPEYWTGPMLDALELYLADGGKMMYLGGNGFYWVTGVNDDRSHVAEVRRGINGTRAWTSHPGETFLSTTGEPGGLWRNRGRTPNKLVGVGFTSEGWGGAPGYTVLPEGKREDIAFVFAGIDADETIGDFGYVMGGAAGDEIDRYDRSLGSPAETTRLATTQGKHTDYYQLVIEDCSFMLPGHGGTDDELVRSDMTMTRSPSGGAVFSVGSINWIGSLMWNGADNNVSKVTSNVLDNFLGDTSLAR